MFPRRRPCPVHDDDAIGDEEGCTHVLLDEQDGKSAVIAQVGQGGDDLADDLRRQTQARLVEHDDGRVRHEGTSHGQHLLLAAGERPRRQVDPVREAREELKGGSPSSGISLVPHPDPPPEGEVVLDGERWEDETVLWHVRQPAGGDLLGPEPRDVLAIECDSASSGAEQARDGSQQRRLAGAVGADDGDQLAGIDGDRDVVEHFEAVVCRSQPSHAKAAGRWGRVLRCPGLVRRGVHALTSPSTRAAACRTRLSSSAATPR